jgi:hypothetical protein
MGLELTMEPNAWRLMLMFIHIRNDVALSDT